MRRMPHKEFIKHLEIAEHDSGISLRENGSISEINRRMPQILRHAHDNMLYAILNDLIYRSRDGSTVEMSEFWKTQCQKELERRADEELLKP